MPRRRLKLDDRLADDEHLLIYGIDPYRNNHRCD